MKTLKNFALIFIATLILPFNNIRAQETLGMKMSEEQVISPTVISTTTEANQQLTEVTTSVEADMDENIEAEDLGVSNPKILSDNAFYKVKNFWQGLRSAFTFNPIKKAELKLQYANEKLIEAKTMAEVKNNPELAVRALEKYQEQIAGVSKALENASDKTKEKASDLAEKIIDYSFKQQNLIDGLEKKFDAQQTQIVQQAKNRSLENLGKIIGEIIPTDEINDKINAVIDGQTGSEFKDFKNLEVLKAVEQKVPEVAREAVRQVQQNILQKLEVKIDRLQEKESEKFQNYVENIGGNKAVQLEVIEDLSQGDTSEKISQKLEKSKEKIVEKMERLKEKIDSVDSLTGQEEQNQIANPASEFCVKKGGNLEIKTDGNGSQFGVCHLPDGTTCEEWAFFRGECAQNNEKKNTLKDKETSASSCPEISRPACENGIIITAEEDENGCPLKLECMGLGEKEIPGQPQLRIIEPIKPVPVSGKRGKTDCIQVITPAMKDGVCKEFPTPCDVPSGWQKVERCEKSVDPRVQMDKPVMPQEKLQPQPIIQPETTKKPLIKPEGSLGGSSLFEKIKKIFK